MHVLMRPSTSSPSHNDVVAVRRCDLWTMTFGSSDNSILTLSFGSDSKRSRCIAKFVVEVLGSYLWQ